MSLSESVATLLTHFACLMFLWHHVDLLANLVSAVLHANFILCSSLSCSHCFLRTSEKCLKVVWFLRPTYTSQLPRDKNSCIRYQKLLFHHHVIVVVIVVIWRWLGLKIAWDASRPSPSLPFLPGPDYSLCRLCHGRGPPPPEAALGSTAKIFTMLCWRLNVQA